jgi:D-alanyl-D-alanine dipeptidase
MTHRCTALYPVWVTVAIVALGGGADADDGRDLVDVGKVIPDAVIDIRYATKDNFTGATLYAKAVCKLRRAVAERLVKAAASLRMRDRRLLVWDCYRPTSVQEKLWKLVPDPRYVANPKIGSKHSRGAAVDVGIVNQAGEAVLLPTAYDDFTEAAHREKALAGERGIEARQLEAAMTDAGFVGLSTEWWHFDAPEQYPLSDEPL